MTDEFLKEVQEIFLCESEELLEKAEACCLELEKGGNLHDVYARLKRIAHNLKGSGQAVGFQVLSKFSHKIENLIIALNENQIPPSDEATQLLLECFDGLKNDIAKLRVDIKSELQHDDLMLRLENILNQSSNPVAPTVAPVEVPVEMKAPESSENAVKNVQASAPKDEYIRVPMKRIDELLDAFGEQVIYLSALDHFKNDLENNRDDLIRTIFNLKKLAFDIQQSTLNLRMVTLKTLFSKLERGIRDAARLADKKVESVLVGSDLELDKIIVDQLSDPLTHMVRNSVDHGLEMPADRLLDGKSEHGTVKLVAKREGGAFVIEIHDDGRGLDVDKIRAKAIEKGLMKTTDVKTDKETYELIFENGFSTKEKVSELSGRGVGMNVVKEMILGLKGSYEIESQKGKGTVFKIKLPLSLSLFNGLLLEIGGCRYLVPSSQVFEILNSDEVEVCQVATGKTVAHVRDSVFEVVELSGKLGKTGKTNERSKKREMILVTQFGGARLGFIVERVLGIQRVVQKPLSPEMGQCPGAVGVTILGDGSPAVILDLKLLKESFVSRSTQSKPDQRRVS